jgi:hypothetical protein
MAVFRGIDGSHWGGPRSDAPVGPAHEQIRRPARSGQLGTGTLACRRCDAPVAIGPEPLLLTEQLTCPFCQNRGAVRDFLSLTPPTRPARVVIRVGLPAAG